MIFALSTLSSNLVELGWFSVVALFLLCFLPLVWCERRGLATFFGSVSFLVCLLVFACNELSWLQLLSRAAAMSATAQCMYQFACCPRDERDRSPWQLYGAVFFALFVLQLIMSKYSHYDHGSSSEPRRSVQSIVAEFEPAVAINEGRGLKTKACAIWLAFGADYVRVGIVLPSGTSYRVRLDGSEHFGAIRRLQQLLDSGAKPVLKLEADRRTFGPRGQEELCAVRVFELLD